jgi:hypothetical protein
MDRVYINCSNLEGPCYTFFVLNKWKNKLERLSPIRFSCTSHICEYGKDTMDRVDVKRSTQVAHCHTFVDTNK